MLNKYLLYYNNWFSLVLLLILFNPICCLASIRIDSDNWDQDFVNASSIVVVDSQYSDLYGIFLDAIDKTNKEYQKNSAFSLSITNLSADINAQTVAIYSLYQDLLQLNSDFSTPTNYSKSITLADNSSITVSSLSGSSIGILADTIFDYDNILSGSDYNLEILSNYSNSHLIQLGDKTTITVEAQAGEASGIVLNNTVQLSGLRLTTFSDNDYKIETNSSLSTGDQTIIQVTANEKAIAISNINLFNYNTTLSHTYSTDENALLYNTDIQIGKNNQILSTSTEDDAYAIKVENLNTFDVSFSNTTYGYLIKLGGEHNSSMSVDENSIISAQSDLKTAYALSLVNSTEINLLPTITSLSDLVKLSTQFISADNVTFSAIGNEAAYAIYLVEELNNNLAAGKSNILQLTSSIVLTLAENNTILAQSTDGNSYGIYAVNQSENQNYLQFDDQDYSSTISISLGDNIQINSTTEGQSANAYGIYLSNQSQDHTESDENLTNTATTLVLEEDATINVYSASAGHAYALYADGLNQVIKTADNSAGTYDFLGDIYASNQAAIQLNAINNSTLYSDLTSDNATIDISLSDNGYLEGNILAENAGTVNLQLDNQTQFTGYTQLTLNNDSNINIRIANGSQWSITGDSIVSLLQIEDALITFTSANTTYSSNSNNYNLLTIGQLAGTTGTFSMSVDFDNVNATAQQADYKDFISITEGISDQAQYKISVRNNAAYSGNKIDSILLVHSATASDASTFSDSGVGVEVGAFIYNLSCVEDDPSNCYNWALQPTEILTSTAAATINTINAAYFITYADTQTTLQRLGELHDNPKDNDLWIRQYNGGYRSFSPSLALTGFHMNYYAVQLGYDRHFIGNDNQQYWGLMAGINNGEPKYTYGSAALKSWNAGIYHSLIYDDHFYIDSLVKYTTISHRYNLLDSQYNLVIGKARTWGITGGILLGKRFYFADYVPVNNNLIRNSNNGYYLEPQFQLTYTYNNSTHYTASNHLDVKLDNYHSLLGNVTLQAGYNNNFAQTPFNGYMKLSYLKEMTANCDFTFNNMPYQQNFSGSWIVAGIGFSTFINNKHTFYIDMEKNIGHRFDKYQLNFGYRVRF